MTAWHQHPAIATVQQRGPGIAVIVLGAIIAWQLATLIWQLIPGRQSADILPPPSAIPTSSQPQTAVRATDVSSVINAHLFGIANPDPEPDETVDPDLANVNETDLPLVLRGTLDASSETDAMAIIADGREENVFRLKDTVRRGVTLHAVQTTQVILNRGGVLEALRLPEIETTASTPSQRPTARPGATRRAPTVSQVITQNASTFTQIISPRPYFVGGQQRGYRLYPGSDRRKFAALGLRPGDIVTEINGTALTNPTQGAQIFSQLGDAQSITATIERNGKPQTLTLDTTQLDVGSEATQ
ncbi:MAG: type II secretion system protein GspC [Pseudomonadota bacterium]